MLTYNNIENMLHIKNIETGYDKKQILFSLSLEVARGEIAAVIGPNGAGKSTLLKAIYGILPVWKGIITLDDKVITNFSPIQSIHNGMTYIPQGNKVFEALTVMENLKMAGHFLSSKVSRERIGEVIQMFPVLGIRLRDLAGVLSGGEKQMLALARALITHPDLLLLDEPSLGLSPEAVNSIFKWIIEYNREMGVTMLIVEQRLKKVLDLCHRVYSLKLGKMYFSGVPEELRSTPGLVKSIFL